MSVAIKNWAKHQHFKDRTPPWIKLYREILEDPDWHALDGEVAKTLVGLWLVASEDETKTGTLPDLRKLAFRLRTTEDKLNQHLNKLSEWLIFSDDDLISSCHRGDAPETETETEKETEREKRKEAKPVKPAVSMIPELTEKLMRDFLAVRKAKKQPLTETAVDGIRAQAEKAGLTIEQAIKICCENGWAGFKASWDWEGKRNGQANGAAYDPNVAGGGRKEL